MEAAIVSAKREKPHWGARKIRERLLRRLPHAVKVPAAQNHHWIIGDGPRISKPLDSISKSVLPKAGASVKALTAAP